MNQSEQILRLAQSQAVLRATDVRQRGWSSQLLLKLHQAGKLQRIGRGIYSLPDASLTEHHGLVEVCQRVPKAVVCLLSALQFHEIGTQQPYQVWIALPEASHAPTLDHPQLRVARLRGAAYIEGVQTVMVEGTPVRIYSVAKTVTDCFKFRNKIGLDVALEALKEAWRSKKITMTDIAHFAKINRVDKVMQPYLEAIVA